MKKVGMLFMVALVIAANVLNVLEQSKGAIDELMLSNIEALANFEYVPGRCFGDGHVDCPDGSKVAYVLEPLALE